MRVLVQFDGSNFYNYAKKVSPKTHLTHYDYAGLAKRIAKSSKAKTIYYVGEIRKVRGRKKSERLYASQQALFSHLRAQEIEVKLGFLLLSGGKYHEKGVDVQIAVGLVRGALRDEYDICYLISSDTDLLPAIKTAKEEGKTVIYVGFENFLSRAMCHNCNGFSVLKKAVIEKFAHKS